MNTQTNKKLPLPLYVLSLISANGCIIISLMYLTFHFIDNVNFAMGFVKSEATQTLLVVLSILSAFTAAAVLIILNYRNSKSYFFRKVAFMTFWICIFCALLQFEVILVNVFEITILKFIWFTTSVLSIITSVFCNGLLVANSKEKNKLM